MCMVTYRANIFVAHKHFRSFIFAGIVFFFFKRSKTSSSQTNNDPFKALPHEYFFKKPENVMINTVNTAQRTVIKSGGGFFVSE